MEFENLLKLINAVSASTLTGFEYEERDVKLSLKREANGQVAAVNPALAAPVVETVSVEAALAATANSAELEGNIIKSPLVGTFYVAPAEDAAPFVKVGERVEKGQTLAIVEAMKLMNDIESEFDGEVAEVYVQNGAAVEYGQSLFRIK